MKCVLEYEYRYPGTVSSDQRPDLLGDILRSGWCLSLKKNCARALAELGIVACDGTERRVLAGVWPGPGRLTPPSEAFSAARASKTARRKDDDHDRL